MKNRLLAISIICLSLSIIFSSLWLGAKIEQGLEKESSVMTLEEASRYLKISEEEIIGIIDTEQENLSKSGSFYGKMFPYFVVNDKTLFYKNEIDLWLKEVVTQKTEY